MAHMNQTGDKACQIHAGCQGSVRAFEYVSSHRSLHYCGQHLDRVTYRYRLHQRAVHLRLLT
jgi:hypothetical protein